MNNFKTTDAQTVRVYEIAAQMKASGLDNRFITGAVEIAKIYEGAFDLLCLWVEEPVQEDKDAIVVAIQDEIDEFNNQPQAPLKIPYVNFSDLDMIANNVTDFKKALKNKVDNWGGITKLSKETGIPQPSLSRFFSSASMPRRVTLYKIANALKLSEKDIVTDWVS